MKDYTLSELRRITESYVKHVKDSLNESWYEEPSYSDIKKAFNPHPFEDSATIQIVPTHRFISLAYSIFNKEFFGGKLPDNLLLEIDTKTDKDYVGLATFNWNSLKPDILTPVKISLNTKYRMTFHEWLEVLLHECVHTYEYVVHPEPFVLSFKNGKKKSSYDAHGAWFLDCGSQFDQYGFHVRKYCQAVKGKTYDINIEDTSISSKYEKSKNQFLIATLVGISTEHGGGDIKISRNFKPKLEYIATSAKKTGIEWWKDIERIVYSTTDNINSIDWKKVSPRDYTSAFTYRYHDIAEKKYGPYKFESEFVVNADNGTSMVDAMKRDIFSNEDRLVEKILRSISGMWFSQFWNTKTHTKNITPTIKLSNGMLLDCGFGYLSRSDSMILEENKSRIYINTQFIDIIRMRYPSLMDYSLLMDDYNDYRTPDDYTGKPRYSQTQAINLSIDTAISNTDKSDLDGARNYIRNALKELKERTQNAEQTEGQTMTTESSELNEDIDEIDIEDRSVNPDEEYARHIYDSISGVENVEINDDGSVNVDIW